MAGHAVEATFLDLGSQAMEQRTDDKRFDWRALGPRRDIRHTN